MDATTDYLPKFTIPKSSITNVIFNLTKKKQVDWQPKKNEIWTNSFFMCIL